MVDLYFYPFTGRLYLVLPTGDVEYYDNNHETWCTSSWTADDLIKLTDYFEYQGSI